MRLLRASYLALAAALCSCVCTTTDAQSQTAAPAASAGPSATHPPAANAPASPKPFPAANQESKSEVGTGEPLQANTIHAQRKAAKLYLAAVKLIEKDRPEEAWGLLKQAVALDPGNGTYARASELARQSAVTRLVQQAAQPTVQLAAPSTAATGANETNTETTNARPNPEKTRLLERALEIDPENPTVLEHLAQLEDEVAAQGVGTQSSTAIGKAPEPSGLILAVEPSKEKHSFHLRSNTRQIIQEVFRAYGVEATLDDSVVSHPSRLDLDDVPFTDAMRILSLTTHTFYEPLDPHRALVAADTKPNRTQFQRLQMETFYLPGLTDKDLTDVGNLARNVFDAQQAVVEPTQSTLTLRAPGRTLDAFQRTIGSLESGKNQLDLNVKVIEVSHLSDRETGTTFFQQTGAYNVASELNSILQQNQSAVQEIIAEGLVPNSVGLANQEKIFFLLLAGGLLTGPPFNQGLLLFGNGITASILAVSPATLALSLNSSDTRTLDDIHIRLSDDEAGTYKVGERYPIEQSSFSSVALPAIAGLSSALASAQSQVIPQVQYEDLGLTLKATPRIMRSGDVALTLDLKIQALGGTALNDIPILDSRAISGVVTLQAGETAVLVSDLSLTESRALNGLPGLSDIPGLQDVSDISRDRNVARLLILVTPRVVRQTQDMAHTPRIMMDRGTISTH